MDHFNHLIPDQWEKNRTKFELLKNNNNNEDSKNEIKTKINISNNQHRHFHKSIKYNENDTIESNRYDLIINNKKKEGKKSSCLLE